MLAAMRTDRNSIGIEIDASYCELALKRIKREGKTLFNNLEIDFHQIGSCADDAVFTVSEQ